MNRFGVFVFVLFSGFLLSDDKSSWRFYESDDVIDGYWSVVTGTDPEGRTLRFYDSGTLQLKNGDSYICADAKGDYKRLGHSDATTTLRFYAHLIPNSDLINVESFEKNLVRSIRVTR